MKVVTYDTGPTCGVAQWRPTVGLGEVWSANMPREEAELHMRDVIMHADVVVLEKLTISMATIKKTREVQVAIEMAGVVKHYARLYDKPVTEQQPSQAMNLVTDEKLRRMGWYVPGPDHQRDARRHLVVYLLDHRLIDPRTLLPKEVQ